MYISPIWKMDEISSQASHVVVSGVRVHTFVYTPKINSWKPENDGLGVPRCCSFFFFRYFIRLFSHSSSGVNIYIYIYIHSIHLLQTLLVVLFFSFGFFVTAFFGRKIWFCRGGGVHDWFRIPLATLRRNVVFGIRNVFRRVYPADMHSEDFISQEWCNISTIIDLYTLPETNSSHLKIGHPKRKRESIPTIHFQVQAVSFGGCKSIIQNKSFPKVPLRRWRQTPTCAIGNTSNAKNRPSLEGKNFCQSRSCLEVIN